MIIDAEEDGMGMNDDMSSDWETLMEEENMPQKQDMTSIKGAEYLTQEGIDNLLGYRFSPQERSSSKGMKYLANTNFVSNQRLPVLEIIFDRLVRLMTTSLRNFTSDSVEISVEGVEPIRLGEYLDGICLPSVISVFKAEEWNHHGLISIDTDLMYTMVDILLGGRRMKQPIARELRPYTSIEMSLAERLVQIVLTDIETSFQPVADISMNYIRMESDPRFATIGRPTDSGIMARFRLDMEGRGGQMKLLLPFAMLEPIRQELSQIFIGEGDGNDNIWENHISSEIQESSVEISAILSEQWLNLQDILTLNVGDTIDLKIQPEESIKVKCGTAILGEGNVGQKGKSLAIAMRDKPTFSSKDILKAQQI